jgi:TPR repeat protein
MNKRIATVVVCLALALPPSLEAQTFVAPQPKAPKASASPPAQSSPRTSQRSRRQTASTAPDSQCAQMTKDWADYRPILDFPSAQGRVSYDVQVASVGVCEAEQAARPSDLRVAFLFARALEVNDKGTRATGLYRQLSDAGYAPATTQLARAYRLGSGVAPNPVQACDLYVKAARAGDAWAFNPAADCLSFQDYAHDARLACRFFQQAQRSGTFQTQSLTREDYCP